MRVVIAGAGFAGLTLAQRLPPSLRVTVLDPEPRFGFLPNIHELVSGVKRPADLELDRAALVRRAGHRFEAAAVASVDLADCAVTTTTGEQLAYDHLVVAVGGVDRLDAAEGVAEHALPFKSVAQCHAIGQRLRDLLRDGDSAPPRHVVVVGGGLEGVECVGEVLRRYRHNPALRLHLVDGRSRLLSGTPAALDAHLRRLCETHGVILHLERRVARVASDRVVLDDDTELASDATLWTGGLAPPALLNATGLAGTQTGWGKVDVSLRAQDRPGIWLAGDAAEPPTPLSKQAYYAMQMGAHLAESLQRTQRSQAPRPFRPRAKPMLIAFGDLDTFLVTDRITLAGPSLAALKEGVFQASMAQLQGVDGGRGATSLGQRLAQSARRLLLPQLTSLTALRRLPGVRVLRD